MLLTQIAERLDLKVHVPPAPDREAQGGYVSDLLSDVMGNARTGSIWVTIQSHPNIVAVAALGDLAGIIMAHSVEPDPQTLEKAREHKIPLFTSHLTAFEVVGALHSLGIRGADRRSHAGL